MRHESDIQSQICNKLLLYSFGRSILLSLNVRSKHTPHRYLRILSHRLLSQMHLRMGYITLSVHSQILIIDQRCLGVTTIPPDSADEALSLEQNSRMSYEHLSFILVVENLSRTYLMYCFKNYGETKFFYQDVYDERRYTLLFCLNYCQ